MPLPSSGRIKLSDVNTELGLASTTRVSLNQASVRTLLGVGSGRIRLAADGYGKANRVALSQVFSANTTDSTVTASSLPGYIAGKTDLTITVNSGIYVYSTNIANAGLTITGATAGDTIALVNNGFIMGKGGNADVGSRSGTQGGGPALSINYNINLTNNSYIAGGGGSGGGLGFGPGVIGNAYGGGGGAGGGTGGGPSGGAGGGPGSSGSNGGSANIGGTNYYGGGGGGRILPGTGGGSRSAGGGSGGASGGGSGASGGTGGSANNAGSSTSGSGSTFRSGGGGGWGAAGGNATNSLTGTYFGGPGGKAINLNGYSITYSLTGTIYGGVS